MRLRIVSGNALLAAAAALAGPARAEQPADLILRNGAVYTLDASRSWAEAVAVRGGRIVYVGTSEGAGKLAGPSTRVVDLSGKMVLPAFHDAHVHPVSGGMELAQCNLNGLDSKEKVFEAIRKYAAAHPKDPWILGGGWDLPLFPGGNPTRQELDAIVPDRPALLSSSDGHSSWANTKALAIAGITKATPDPPAGRIERDSQGNPSGTLRETADEAVEAKAPQPTAREYEEGLARGLEM
ncbi:MAG TPA: amidohydrolase family protein, partial [Thermoanaerobaculia bacterium]